MTGLKEEVWEEGDEFVDFMTDTFGEVMVMTAAVKDLVIWKRPMQTAWSRSWKPVHSPKVVMEWKVFFKKHPPRAVFNRHDEEWIASYTAEQTSSLGYLVSVDLASEEPMVCWEQAKAGVFSKPRAHRVVEILSCGSNCADLRYTNSVPLNTL